MGSLAMAAQIFFTQGYGYAKLAVGTLLSLLVPVIAGLFAVLFLKETLAPHFILGTLMILAGCGILNWEESRQKLIQQGKT